MLPKAIRGMTRLLGKSQGYKGLPVADIELDGIPAMRTSWELSPQEIEDINNGHPVYVTLLGTSHPPILVETGPHPSNGE